MIDRMTNINRINKEISIPTRKQSLENINKKQLITNVETQELSRTQTRLSTISTSTVRDTFTFPIFNNDLNNIDLNDADTEISINTNDTVDDNKKGNIKELFVNKLKI